jgi:protein TonB
MELKKNPKADLESMKSIFFMAGIAISLGIVLLAFNLSSSVPEIDPLEGYADLRFEEEEIPPSRQEQPPMAKPPPPPLIIDEFFIRNDNEELEKELSINDQEINLNTPIDYSKLMDPSDEEEDDFIFITVEKMPEFPGGDIGLRRYIATNIKYPNIARQKGIEGIVYIKFCVTSTGKVEKVSVERGIDPILDQEALRVVNSLPKWTPGEQRGRKVSVWYSVPINFDLGNR